ncbi:MAG TPA: hypothetical protein VG122_19215 [Gemmata sp.]|jgi:hypothetical protein|nr:hypothetical protein [Gemmata sp.]
MIILALFNTAGYIFGPIIVIAGVVALTLCLVPQTANSCLISPNRNAG